jgi:hypothetical protein
MDAGSLRQEVSRLLAGPESRELGRLDPLLTDCAAATLRLSAESRRIERELDAALARESQAGHETEPVIRALVRRSRELAAERRQLGELMQALRAMRDRVVGPSSTLT